MDATVQTAIVLLVVALAALFVARRAWAAVRPRRADGCASDCGCGSETSAGGGDWSKS